MQTKDGLILNKRLITLRTNWVLQPADGWRDDYQHYDPHHGLVMQHGASNFITCLIIL